MKKHCSVCGEKLGFFNDAGNGLCEKCWEKQKKELSIQAAQLPQKPESETNGAQHGVFTDIAYITAWAAAILGTLTGTGMIFVGLVSYGNEQISVLGLVVVISSWIGASGVGTLSEISRKLSYTEMAAKKALSQED